jgi:hypothetical protein
MIARAAPTERKEVSTLPISREMLELQTARTPAILGLYATSSAHFISNYF